MVGGNLSVELCRPCRFCKERRETIFQRGKWMRKAKGHKGA